MSKIDAPSPAENNDNASDAGKIAAASDTPMLAGQPVGIVTEQEPKELEHKWSIFAAWVLAFIVGLWAICARHPFDRAEWLILVISIVSLISFCLQLIVGDKNGFIVRLSLSIAGAAGLTLILDIISRLTI